MLVGAGCLVKPPPPADQTGDGGPGSGGHADCAHWGAFSDPTPLPEQMPANTWGPWLSDGGLELLVTEAATGSTSNLDIMRKRRATAGTPFLGPPTLLAIDTVYVEENPYVTADGLDLWFDSDAYDAMDPQLYTAHRGSRDDDFTNPVRLATFSVAAEPTLTRDKHWLVFSSGHGPAQILAAQADANGVYGPPTTLGLPVDSWSPSVTGDGTELYFTTTSGAGFARIYVSALDPAFSASNAHELFPGGNDYQFDPSIATDGTTLIFSSSTSMVSSLVVTTRVCNP